MISIISVIEGCYSFDRAVNQSMATLKLHEIKSFFYVRPSTGRNTFVYNSCNCPTILHTFT